MFERAISADTVLNALKNGKTVEEYGDDTPYPSSLLLGYSSDGRPLHVVAAQDPDSKLCIIITAYIPDPSQWDKAFTRRCE